MLWSDLNLVMSQLLLHFPPPDVLIIHLGGNDIGKRKTLDIIFQIRDDLQTIQLTFPNTRVIFSEIVQRWEWLSPPSGHPFEKNQKKG